MIWTVVTSQRKVKLRTVLIAALMISLVLFLLRKDQVWRLNQVHSVVLLMALCTCLMTFSPD